MARRWQRASAPASPTRREHSPPAACSPGWRWCWSARIRRRSIYVRNKTEACAEAGFRTFDHRLPATTSEARAARAGRAAQRRPGGRRHPGAAAAAAPASTRAACCSRSIRRKDVDGFHPDNLGPPAVGEPRFVACTPFGIMKLIEEAGVAAGGQPTPSWSGARTSSASRWPRCCIAADATVTVCHSRTRDLAGGRAPRRCRGRRRRPRRDDHGRLDQAGRGGDRRRHQPRCRRQAGRRRRVRRGAPSAPRRSRPCPAASAR